MHRYLEHINGCSRCFRVFDSFLPTVSSTLLTRYRIILLSALVIFAKKPLAVRGVITIYVDKARDAVQCTISQVGQGEAEGTCFTRCFWRSLPRTGRAVFIFVTFRVIFPFRSLTYYIIFTFEWLCAKKKKRQRTAFQLAVMRVA